MAELTAADEADYAELVAQAAASPLSHSLAYRDVLAGAGLGEPLYWLCRQGQKLLAAVPGFVKRSALGGVYNSLPLVQSPGGFVYASDLSPDARQEVASLMFTALWKRVHAAGCQVCVFIGTPFEGVPALPTPAHAERFALERTTHVLDLDAPPALDHAAREALRKALAAHPTHHRAASLPEARLVWRLYAENMERVGVRPRPWAIYEDLFMRAPSHTRFVWAELEGKPVCSLISFVHGHVVDYHAAGNTELGRRAQVSTWLCVQELEAAATAGARFWNWGVSPTPAVAAFKGHFGGYDRTYPIVGFFGEAARDWLRLPPTELAAAFPDHFVLPYALLQKESP